MVGIIILEKGSFEFKIDPELWLRTEIYFHLKGFSIRMNKRRMLIKQWQNKSDSIILFSEMEFICKMEIFEPLIVLPFFFCSWYNAWIPEIFKLDRGWIYTKVSLYSNMFHFWKLSLVMTHIWDEGTMLSISTGK